MRRRFTLMALPIVVFFTLTGCSKSSLNKAGSPINKGKPASTKKLTGKELKNKVLGDVKNDIAAYVSVKKNVGAYSKAFSDVALETIKKQFNNDKSKGRLKIRVHNNRKFSELSVDTEQGRGEAKYTFTDGSYYVDFNTEKPLTKATNKPQTFVLALQEDKNGDWKIAGVYQPVDAPHKGLQKDPKTGKWLPPKSPSK